MNNAYSADRRKLWPLVVAGVVVVLLVAGVSLGIGLWMGRGSSEPTGPTGGDVTTPAPTWDVTAQPVPNEDGSYGQNQPSDVARSFVIEFFSWSPDEQLPEGWLSRTRPTVSDDLFELLMEDNMETPIGDAGDDVVGRKINVVDVRNDVGDPTKLNVIYQVTDIMADGTEQIHDETDRAGIELTMIDVELSEGSGTKTIQEYRVDSVFPDEVWLDEEGS